jgi:hypothetical protein
MGQPEITLGAAASSGYRAVSCKHTCEHRTPATSNDAAPPQKTAWTATAPRSKRTSWKKRGEQQNVAAKSTNDKTRAGEGHRSLYPR